MRGAAKFVPVIAVLALCLATAWSEPVSSLKPTNYVNDFAGVLSEKTKTDLNNAAQQLQDKTGAQVAVAVINSTDGEDIFNYGVDLFQKWGIGKKGKDNGVLILLAVKDRKYYTHVGYGLEPILNDAKVGDFGREAVPYLRAGDYTGAVSLMASRVIDVIAKDAGVQITTTAPPPALKDTPQQLSGGDVLLLIFGFILLMVILRALSRRGGGGGGRGGLGGVGPFILGSGLGSSLGRGGWGGGWGGGFGGGGWGGGGGGFGGFGGGGTGGGGAGGSW